MPRMEAFGTTSTPAFLRRKMPRGPASVWFWSVKLAYDWTASSGSPVSRRMSSAMSPSTSRGYPEIPMYRIMPSSLRQRSSLMASSTSAGLTNSTSWQYTKSRYSVFSLSRLLLTLSRTHFLL